MSLTSLFEARSFLFLAAVSLLGACEVEAPSADPLAPAERPEPKLYAPGAPTAEPEPGAPSKPETTPRSDGEALRAALLGSDKEPPSSETEPEPRRTRRPRRRVQTAETAETPEGEPLDEPAAPGSLSDGAFQSVITDWSGMKRCLATATGRLGPGSGALEVAFTIRGDGQVVRSRVVETSNEVARAIAPCVERRAKRIRFPAFAATTDKVEKTAKFIF